MTGVQEKANLTREQSDEALQRFTDGFLSGLRAPVLHWPSEVGLEYEDVTFPARDGVPLEGWFIPAPESAKLIIANHPFSFSRSGIPAHVEPWHAIWAPSGNGFEVNLVPDYKILHDAGYHVLTYDLRNHGLSGAANGGVVTNGVTESRDVAGSLDYARERFGARQMSVGLFSRCTGGNATFCAMARWPAAFDGVRCLVSPEPITTAIIIQHRMAVFGIADRLEDFTFPARDGVPLEGWFIPAPGSAKLIIANSQHRKEAAVDREHDSSVGRLHGVPAPPPAHARLVRAVPMIYPRHGGQGRSLWPPYSPPASSNTGPWLSFGSFTPVRGRSPAATGRSDRDGHTSPKGRNIQ